MHISKIALTAAVFLVSVTTAVAAIGPAGADPPPGVTPVVTDVVSVGSDTAQVLNDALSKAWNNQSPAPAFHYYNWDATGPSPIAVKAGQWVERPNGASAGISALSYGNALDPATGHQTEFDLATSDRGPGFGNTDTFIYYAQDLVGWAGFTSSSPGQTDSPPTLSFTDLQKIYNCTYTNWNQITDIPGYTGRSAYIKAFLPQPGSGLRTQFLTILGFSGSSAPCWQSTTPEENEGTNPVFNDPSVIFPYSIGHYVGQYYDGKAFGADAPGYLDARRSILNPPSQQVGGTPGTYPQIDTSAHTINRSLLVTYFGDYLYNVVLTSDWTGTGPEAASLKALFGKASAGGWLCSTQNSTNTTNNIIAANGFLPLPAIRCGIGAPGT